MIYFKNVKKQSIKKYFWKYFPTPPVSTQPQSYFKEIFAPFGSPDQVTFLLKWPWTSKSNQRKLIRLSLITGLSSTNQNSIIIQACNRKTTTYSGSTRFSVLQISVYTTTKVSSTINFCQFFIIVMVRHYLNYFHLKLLLITPMNTTIPGPVVRILMALFSLSLSQSTYLGCGWAQRIMFLGRFLD